MRQGPSACPPSARLIFMHTLCCSVCSRLGTCCHRFRDGKADYIVALAERVGRNPQPRPARATCPSARAQRLQRLPVNALCGDAAAHNARRQDLRRWCEDESREAPRNIIAGVTVHFGELINFLKEHGGPGSEGLVSVGFKQTTAAWPHACNRRLSTRRNAELDAADGQADAGGGSSRHQEPRVGAEEGLLQRRCARGLLLPLL